MRLAVMLLALSLSACGGSGGGGDGGGSPPPETRSFAMGLMNMPYDLTAQAIDDTYGYIASDADSIALPFDDGVPWNEALVDGAYPASFQARLDDARARIPAGHKVYLALTALNGQRDGIAAEQTAAGSVAAGPPWDGYALDHPDVITAYTNHCRRMIQLYAPDWCAFGIEVNMLYDKAPAKWSGYVNLALAVYATLKAEFPGLPLFQSIQADSFHASSAGQTVAVNQILPACDIVALSAYPFGAQADPALLAGDFFSAIADLGPGKPFAIAETAWPAEDVDAPFPALIPETPARQKTYVDFLLSECRRLRAVFVNWFFPRDYDALWVSVFQYLPDAWLLRLWRDCGLRDGAGAVRPSLDAWRAVLALPRG